MSPRKARIEGQGASGRLGGVIIHNTEPRILRGPILGKIPSCAVTYWEHRSENSTILILVESNPSKGFTKFENLNLNFQRFSRYITTFSKFQILNTVFLNAEFHNEPARYLGYTRDRRKHDRSALTVPVPILACFLFAYVPGNVRPPEPAKAPWRCKSPLP